MTDPASRRLLAVDIGNHQLKFGLMPTAETRSLPQPTRILKIPTQNEALDHLAEWLPTDSLEWCVATVHRPAELRLAEWVRAYRPDDRYVVLGNNDLPIDIHVDHPEQVGADRLLAAVAVNRLRAAGRAAIVVDAGSAITVDLVSAGGDFEGGVILAGLDMAARAMAEQTDLLPLVQYSIADEPPPAVGKSTAGAISSGLFWGTIGAVREVVTRICCELEGDTQLFLAGGDAGKLSPYLPGSARVVPELVLAGIALAYARLNQRFIGQTASPKSHGAQ